MKFSVTIPAYKSRFLHEAIESVVCQTYADWELIIVDDCSPEELAAVVMQYLSDKRIHYYRNEKNCGAINVVDNWNICLSYCTGDYVICMGDDDRLLPSCLEEYSKMLKAYPHLAVYHAKTQIINEDGEVTDIQENRPEYETCKEVLYHQWEDQRKQFIGDFLFSRKWLNKNGGYVKFPLAYSSDWATANLATKESGIANGQIPMFEYRDNNNSISRSQNLKIAVRSCNSSYKWYAEVFKEILPPFFGKYFIRNMTDMIYLDVRQSPIAGTVYWLTHCKGLSLTYTKIAETCIRGIFASIRNKKSR